MKIEITKEIRKLAREKIIDKARDIHFDSLKYDSIINLKNNEVKTYIKQEKTEGKI